MSSQRTHKPYPFSSQIQQVSDRFGSSSFSVAAGDKSESNVGELLFGSPVTPLRTAMTAVTNTSSSSSSSGSAAGRNNASSSTNGLLYRSHSEELRSPKAVDSSGSVGSKCFRPGHRRTCSGPLIYSGRHGGSSNSAGSGLVGGVGSGSASVFNTNTPVVPTNVIPAGNICPSGKILKTGMASRTTSRSDVLGLGTGNYGHGSIIRGGPATTGRRATGENQDLTDLEEIKKAGNEFYQRGQFSDALKMYDLAIYMAPKNAACRSNRAAALIGMGRLDEAVRECEDAVRLEPMNGRVHQRLASLLLRLGQVEKARKHLYFSGKMPDLLDLRKLHSIEHHLNRSSDARRIGDWKSLLKESEAAISAGAISSPQIITTRAEALLRLHRFDEADCALLTAEKLETSSPILQVKIFGMSSNSYLNIVRAQIDMAVGRFEEAESASENARRLDPQNKEVGVVWNTVRSVVRARAHGKELFATDRFSDACLAYSEGLKFDRSNHVLYCNRAVCYSKLGMWEKSIEDCNEALRFHPNYTKALLRRAVSYEKLERWADAVHDYEVLRKELPCNKDIAEALFHAQVAWKASRGEEVSNLKFGGEVERITSIEQFHAAITLPGLSVVYFMKEQNLNSINISPFVDALCMRYPSVNFLKVDVGECEAIGKVENVKIVPTFKIYKNSDRMKEMICPSQHVLEYSVRHYDIQSHHQT